MTGGKTTLLTLALALTSIFTPGARGEDIDIYAQGSEADAPNALIYLDNTSNWSANSNGWSYSTVYSNCGRDAICQSYVNQVFGYAVSLGVQGCSSLASCTLKQGSLEAGALKLVLNKLVCNTEHPIGLNLGLMLLAPAGGAYLNDAGTSIDNNVTAGSIQKAVLPLNDTTCASVISELDGIIQNVTSPQYKTSSSANYGSAMFDAFKYFGGYTNPAHAINNSPNPLGNGAGSPIGHVHFGPTPYEVPTGYEDPLAYTDTSKTTYQSPSQTSCNKNFLVFVGNNGSAGPKADNPALLGNLGYLWSCPSASFPYACNGNQSLVADVWANFLATTDLRGDIAGQQTLKTYALNVYFASPNSTRTALLKSMAQNGGAGASGSGYYEVNGNLKALINAFLEIFTQISAASSVFASSSLPVSVNTQGTYLNQVFIGMFRPDDSAHQRWAGNLKQYQFALDASAQTLYLADALGTAAVDNANTGFIKQCAVSFWTQDTSQFYFDTQASSWTPYWKNVPTGITPKNGCPTPPSPNTTASVYSDWPDGNTVEKGGAGEWLRSLNCGTTPTWCGRKIQTCQNISCSSLADFNTTNVTNLTSSSTSSTLVKWVAGGNLGDGPADPNTGNYQFYNQVNSALAAKTRPSVHGAVVHARPLAVNYGSGATNNVVVFYGADDGLLHAIDGNQTGNTAGQELWAFLAPEFFPASTLTLLDRLREDKPLIAYPFVSLGISPTPTKRDYYFDGSIGAYQERNTDGSLRHLYLYPSMRRGGRMIYAFDATTRPDITKPSFLWKFGCPNAQNNDTAWNDTGCIGGTDAAKIGQTWSSPQVIRLSINGSDALYVAFGGGYDNTCEDLNAPSSSPSISANPCPSTSKGTGIFVLNAATGVQAKYISLGTAAGGVAADVVPVDADGDGYTDVIYAADTRGNVWRINTTQLDTSTGKYIAGNYVAPSNWTAYRLAHVWSSAAGQLNGTQYRKFLYAPAVVSLGNTNMVYIGSGDREHPLRGYAAASVENRFYGLRDIYDSIPSDIDGTDCDPPNDTVLDPSCTPGLLDVTNTLLNYSTALQDPNVKGWVFDLDTVTPDLKEQVVTTPAVIGGAVYFSTFQPSDTNTQCSNIGTARGYAVNLLTGGLFNGGAARSAIFTGGGMAPSPVTGNVDVDGQTVPFIIGGKPQSGTGSPLEGQIPPIPVSAKPNKVYRYQKIDTK